MIRGLLILAAAAAAACSAGVAAAQRDSLPPPGTERANTLQIHIREPGEGPVSERVTLPLGQAAVIHLPVDAADIMVANPEVADTIVRAADRTVVLGQGVGSTNIFFFDPRGQLILDLAVRVERDIAALEEALRRYVPDGRIEAESMNSNIVLSGTVPSASAADAALQVAQRFADEPEQVLSFLTIEGRDQVMLKVKIVEMERNIVRQLGVNLDGNVAFGEFDATEGGFPSRSVFSTDNAFGIANSALGGLSGTVGYDNFVNGFLQSSLGLTLNALERVGLVRTLAEPNITAISGESANFLAGGEFPVPVGRDRDGNITLEFKPFGVGLGFTPVVLSEGRISLRVSTEVSELSSEGAIALDQSVIRDEDGNIIGVVDGLSIPALTVNRAETTVELPSGGSLVIAGLIKEETRQAMDGVPGVERLPVLGALFRSRDFANSETELVVVVTPYLVDPVAESEITTPGEGMVAASMLTNIFTGRLNRVYAAPGADVEGRRWRGPVGFMLE